MYNVVINSYDKTHIYMSLFTTKIKIYKTRFRDISKSGATRFPLLNA